MDTDFKCLVIILRALKCIGLCPLDQQSKPKKFRYEFVWNSKETVLSLLVASFMAFVHFISLTHVVFQQFFIFGPGIRHTVSRMEAEIRNSSDLNQSQIAAHLTVYNGTQLITIVQYFCYLWASWRNRHILPHFLSDAVSPGELELGLKVETKSNHRLVSFITLVCGFTLALIPGFLTLSVMTAHDDVAIELVFGSLLWVYTGWMEYGHDACVAFALRHLRHNFCQIRRCIRIRHVPDGRIINKWENAIYSIRQQGHLLSSYLAPAQLMSLVQTIVMCTLCTFSALMMARVPDSMFLGQENKVMHHVVGNLLCTSFFLGRLYYKVSLAQQVTNEESQLALELGRLTIKEHEAAVKVKRLVDMMTCKPCEINLSDLVIMRKGLFLGVASQISTYLVVITQFYQS